MKMKDIYTRYFQKSATFLYPILGMKKSKHPKPRQTYITWGDKISVNDRVLICLYDRDDTDEWLRFEANVLMTHPMLMDSVIVDDEQILYLFDFNVPNSKEDFDNFVNGKYSKISDNGKKLITDYFGIHSAEWIYIESYIHPHKYFKIYADILKVDVNEIKKVGELCDKYNSQKENCSVIINQLVTNKN